MIDLEALQKRFPHHKVISQPAPGCGCNGTGVRQVKSQNRDRPCLCVCMSAPQQGEPEYRLAFVKALGDAARAALKEFKETP